MGRWRLIVLGLVAVLLTGYHSGGECTDRERSTLVSAEHTPAFMTQTAQTMIKLGIQEEGWYRVEQPELVAAGLAPTINPRFLRLFVAGEEVPLVVVGEADGHFDPQDGIEFYGIPLDTAWTTRQMYWLVVDTIPGKRMSHLSGQMAGRPTASHFPYTVERRDRTLYVAAVLNGETSNIFGLALAAEPIEQSLYVAHVAPDAPEDAHLEVWLQGVTTGLHQVSVALNGHQVGTVEFRGQTHEQAALTLSHQWLRHGTNRVTLTATGDGTDVSVLDRIRLTYQRTYAADGHALWFSAQGGDTVIVTGFTESNIRVVDVTETTTIQEVAGTLVTEGETYAITVPLPGVGPRTLLAFTTSAVWAPALIVADQPSHWRQVEHEADLVIIAHEDFLSSLEPLIALRQAQGWHVIMIDVEDLYDEFQFGVKSPWALRDFLLWSQEHWSKPPRFVLLVGDASFDPRQELEGDKVDFVPTKLVATEILETASDDWFADFDEDGVAELAVGRLPVQTPEEAVSVVSKLLNYAQTGATGKWASEALVVVDKRDGFDFTSASAELSAMLSRDLSVDTLLHDQIDVTHLRSELVARLNEGKLLVNYIGHGSAQVWGGEELLTAADVRTLINGERLPVVVNMTCLNGFFHDLYTESLAEALLKAPKGGAVAVWASSGLTRPQAQVMMNQELVRSLFGEEPLTLGEAIQRAKTVVTDQDVRRTWLLFGDPAIRLP